MLVTAAAAEVLATAGGHGFVDGAIESLFREVGLHAVQDAPGREPQQRRDEQHDRREHPDHRRGAPGGGDQTHGDTQDGEQAEGGRQAAALVDRDTGQGGTHAVEYE